MKCLCCVEVSGFRSAPARPGIPAVSCHGDKTTSPLLLTVTPRATEGPAGLVSIWQELCYPDRPWQPALSLTLLFSFSHPCFLSLFRSAWRDDTAFFFIFRTMCPHLYFNGECSASPLYSRHFSPHAHTYTNTWNPSCQELDDSPMRLQSQTSPNDC